MKGFSLEFSAASIHWLAYSAGLISDGMDDLGLTLNFRFGASGDSSGVEVEDRSWVDGGGRGEAEAEALIALGPDALAASEPWESDGVFDGVGGVDVVESSLMDEVGAGCGACDAGSGISVWVPAGGIFRTAEGGSAARTVGDWTPDTALGV